MLEPKTVAIPLNHNLKLVKKLLKKIGTVDEQVLSPLQSRGCFKQAHIVGNYVLKWDRMENTQPDLAKELLIQHRPEAGCLPLNEYIAWGWVDGKLYGVQRKLSCAWLGGWKWESKEVRQWRLMERFRLSRSRHINDTDPSVGHNVGYCKKSRSLLCFDWGCLPLIKFDSTVINTNSQVIEGVCR